MPEKLWPMVIGSIKSKRCWNILSCSGVASTQNMWHTRCPCFTRHLNSLYSLSRWRWGWRKRRKGLQTFSLALVAVAPAPALATSTGCLALAGATSQTTLAKPWQKVCSQLLAAHRWGTQSQTCRRVANVQMQLLVQFARCSCLQLPRPWPTCSRPWPMWVDVTRPRSNQNDWAAFSSLQTNLWNLTLNSHSLSDQTPFSGPAGAFLRATALACPSSFFPKISKMWEGKNDGPGQPS